MLTISERDQRTVLSIHSKTWANLPISLDCFRTSVDSLIRSTDNDLRVQYGASDCNCKASILLTQTATGIRVAHGGHSTDIHWTELHDA